MRKEVIFSPMFVYCSEYQDCRTVPYRTMHCTGQFSDLTPKERDIGKKLRLELKARRDNGETNLVIRRGQIITMNLLPNVGNQQQAQRNTIPNSDKPADTTPQVPQPSGSSGIED